MENRKSTEFAEKLLSLALPAAGKEEYIAAERVFAYVMKVTVIISAVFFLAGLCIPEILMWGLNSICLYMPVSYA